MLPDKDKKTYNRGYSPVVAYLTTDLKLVYSRADRVPNSLESIVVYRRKRCVKEYIGALLKSILLYIISAP